MPKEGLTEEALRRVARQLEETSIYNNLDPDAPHGYEYLSPGVYFCRHCGSLVLHTGPEIQDYARFPHSPSKRS
jgi:hypothetical protein